MIKVKCDKCKKEIDLNNYNAIRLPRNVNLDLCPQCYTSLMKTIGSWLKEEEE